MLWKDKKVKGSIRIEGDVTETAVRGLTPYTNYTFCVVANNAMGNATEECVGGVVTLEGSESMYDNETRMRNNSCFVFRKIYSKNTIGSLQTCFLAQLLK